MSTSAHPQTLFFYARPAEHRACLRANGLRPVHGVSRVSNLVSRKCIRSQPQYERPPAVPPTRYEQPDTRYARKCAKPHFLVAFPLNPHHDRTSVRHARQQKQETRQKPSPRHIRAEAYRLAVRLVLMCALWCEEAK